MSNEIQFRTMSNSEEITEFLSNYTQKHSCYFHYTTVEKTELILSDKNLRMSSVLGFNDEIDKKQFGDEKYLYFSICFSSGQNENLSLWYLYSGIKGTGTRLRFTKNKLNDLRENAEMILHIGNATEPLVNGKNCDMFFSDILYVGRDNKSIRHNNHTRYDISPNEVQKFKDMRTGFCKGLIWYYEKETRLLIKIKNDASKRLKDYMSDINGNEKEYREQCFVELKIPDKILNSIKISFAPEIQDIETAIQHSKVLKQFCINTSNIQLSEHSGEVKMKLCNRCEYKTKESKEDE